MIDTVFGNNVRMSGASLVEKAGTVKRLAGRSSQLSLNLCCSLKFYDGVVLIQNLTKN